MLPSIHQNHSISRPFLILVVATTLLLPLGIDDRDTALRGDEALPSAKATDFPPPPDTEKSSERFLPPDEALGNLRLPAGFHATLFAAEPDVRQPVAMAFDGRGRVWVAENYTYSEREKNFDLSLRDRIVIFDDTDGDGRFDRRKVFWDGGQRLTSVEIGFGGVWALCPPQLLFLPDRDGDDVPDGEPEVLLDGWAAGRVRHNFVNGLRWGPDGWLYGRHGILETSDVGAPGTPTAERASINCGMWRYHPTRRKFEVIASGTTNPFGADWDAHGQLFFINTVIGHLWHVIPGAHFERMYGEDLDPHVYGLIPQTADHIHWGAAEHWGDIRKTGLTPATDRAGGGHAHCGMMIYLGDNWPKEYRGDLFTLNFHGRRLNRDHLVRDGATYVGRHGPDFFRTGDPWFRGVEVTYGPDGGVYVIDWSDVGECHENDGVHRSSGRIYKITHGLPAPRKIADVGRLSDAELVRLQRHENEWYSRQARRVLTERQASGKLLEGSAQALFELFESAPDAVEKLRALWSLHACDALTTPWLIQRLDHPNEHVRLWCVRLLLEGAPATPAVVAALTSRATVETSGLVLVFLASALQQLEPASRWELADALLRHGELSGDRVAPLMIWYGIEPAVAATPARGVALLKASELPLVSRFLARRVTEEIETHGDTVDAFVRFLPKARAPHRVAVLRGMTDALAGWRQAPAPRSWAATAETLRPEASAEVRELLRELAGVFGDGRAIEELRRIAVDTKREGTARRDAVRALARVRAEGAVELLQGLLPHRAVTTEVVRALGQLGGAETPKYILARYPKMRLESRAAAIEALASRPTWAAALLDAVSAGPIGREEVTPFSVRQIQLLGDPTLTQRVGELWPDLRLIPRDKLARIAELRPRFSPQQLTQADASNGKMVFARSCGSCHVLFGEGKKIGPELTGAQRQNLSFWLENIVDPSATLAESFRVSTIVLGDGRVLSGVIQGETPRTLALQTATDRLVLERNAVREIRPTTRSLMPEGLLDVLSEQETRDLMAYLMSRT